MVELLIQGYTGCSFHEKAIQRAKELAANDPSVTFKSTTVERDIFRQWVVDEAKKFNVQHKSSPLIVKDGKFLGGHDSLVAWIKEYEASKVGVLLVDEDKEGDSKQYDFDLVVIGGGSGGMAASKAAASFLGTKENGDQRVCCLDFVKPSPHGTTWGFGGTCVNVGCIPKKLFHSAALARENIKASVAFGATEQGIAEASKFSWDTIKHNVQMHIKSLNFQSVASLRIQNVLYKNSLGTLVDANTIECVNRRGLKETITARRILLAMGGRPKYPDIPGAKYGITSDDIFTLEKEPGKTLVVGASYIALECAGFLNGLGYNTTVLMRSIPLRGFDQQIAGLIVDHMKAEGTSFISGTPLKIEKDETSGKLRVLLSTEEWFECDTVLFAIGRVPDNGIALDKAGVKTAPSGKIIVDKADRTSTPNIYAIGDIIEGGLELTPVAIKAGKLLSGRLYNKQSKLMDYKYVATTVFTPLEYGVVGYSEEDAISIYGNSNIEVYHSFFTPLEWEVREDHLKCYIKIITNRNDDERVVGFHILCPNAGEVLQGVSVAINAGATKAHFDDTVGIHPTIAEMMNTLVSTKSSGSSADQGNC